MKTKSIVLIVISLGFGCIAAVGMVQVMARSKSTAPPTNTRPVLVAIGDLDINDELTEENVRIEQWPVNMIPEGVVADWEGIEGRRIGGRVIKGYPIQSDILLQPGEFSGLNIRRGYKVYAIKVGETGSFVGLLEPGDRIDLVGIMKRSGTNQQIAKTFLRNVRVFAVNDQTRRSTANEEGGADIRIVQLEVTHAQAEKIALVESLGSLRLVLNGNTEQFAKDDEEETEEEASIEELFGNPNREPAQTAEAPADDSGFNAGSLVAGLVEAWNSANEDRSLDNQFAANHRPHTMTMISAEGTFVYTWTDRNLPPTMTDIASGDGSAFSGVPYSTSPAFNSNPGSSPRRTFGGAEFDGGGDSDVDFDSDSPADSDVVNEEDDVDW